MIAPAARRARRRATSNPSRSGSCTSSRTTSGPSRAASASPDVPSGASPTTSQPSDSSSCLALARKPAWSSTIKTLRFTCQSSHSSHGGESVSARSQNPCSHSRQDHRPQLGSAPWELSKLSVKKRLGGSALSLWRSELRINLVSTERSTRRWIVSVPARGMLQPYAGQC